MGLRILVLLLPFGIQPGHPLNYQRDEYLGADITRQYPILRRGFRLYLYPPGGLAMLPESNYLMLQQPNGKRLRVRRLPDLANAVSITNPHEALRYVRLLNYGDPYIIYDSILCEVRYRRGNKYDSPKLGMDGVTTNRSAGAALVGYPKVRRVSQGFAIERYLMVCDTERRRFPVYLATELVSASGEYSRSFSSNLDKRLRGIQWTLGMKQ